MLTFSFLFSTQGSLPIFSPQFRRPPVLGVCGESVRLICRRNMGSGFIWESLQSLNYGQMRAFFLRGYRRKCGFCCFRCERSYFYVVAKAGVTTREGGFGTTLLVAFMSNIIFSASLRANSTGTALPTILYPLTRLVYLKIKLSGKVWIRAHSRKDKRRYKCSFPGTNIRLFCSINFILGACG